MSIYLLAVYNLATWSIFAVANTTYSGFNQRETINELDTEKRREIKRVVEERAHC